MTAKLTMFTAIGIFLVLLVGGVSVLVFTVQKEQAVKPITVETDKTSYSKGEAIRITVTNRSGSTATFPSSTLGLQIIERASGTATFSFIGLTVITELKPGEKREFQWDQKDAESRQVAAGSYMAQISLFEGAKLIQISSPPFTIK